MPNYQKLGFLFDPERYAGRASELFGAIAFPAFAFIGTRFLLSKAADLHWGLGILLAIMLIAFSLFLIASMRKAFFQNNPSRVVVSMFVTIVLVGAAVCANVSYILSSHGLAQYTTDWELSSAKLVDYYIWHFIDMIPSIGFWKSLGVDEPVRPDGVIAGIPILVFRIFVVIPIFALVREWIKQKRNDSKSVGDPGDAA